MKQLFDQARRVYNYQRNRHERRFQRELAAGRTLKLAEVEAVLDRLGIGAGDRVSVHSHSAVLGQVEGGLMALLSHLKERVTPSGLLWMTNSPYRGAMHEYARTDPVFDVRRTPSQMGLFTEIFRRSRGATRSVHPTHSVALWGNEAEAWAAGHDEDPLPFHMNGPYGRLYRHGGKVLFMELDGWHLTEMHTVEGVLRARFPAKAYLEQPVEMRVIDWQKRERRVPVYLHDPVFSAQIDPRHYYPELERRGIVKREKLRGYIPFVVIDVTAMIDYFVVLARRGRDYYHFTSASGYLRGMLMRVESGAPRTVNPPDDAAA